MAYSNGVNYETFELFLNKELLKGFTKEKKHVLFHFLSNLPLVIFG